MLVIRGVRGIVEMFWPKLDGMGDCFVSAVAQLARLLGCPVLSLYSTVSAPREVIPQSTVLGRLTPILPSASFVSFSFIIPALFPAKPRRASDAVEMNRSVHRRGSR